MMKMSMRVTPGFLTTFVREAGAHAFRVHTIPETQDQLKLIVGRSTSKSRFDCN